MCCVQCWAPQFRGDMDILDRVQQRVMKMMKNLSCVLWRVAERARTVKPRQDKTQGGCFQNLEGGYKENQARHFSAIPGERMRKRAQTEIQDFPFIHKKNLFTMRMVKHWQGLHIEVM